MIDNELFDHELNELRKYADAVGGSFIQFKKLDYWEKIKMLQKVLIWLEKMQEKASILEEYANGR